jgi:hypothetical protein
VLAFSAFGLSIYFGQLSIFNIGLIIFEQQYSGLSLLDFQFWLYSLISLLGIVFFIWITKDTIRRLNLETAESTSVAAGSIKKSLRG